MPSMSTFRLDDWPDTEKSVISRCSRIWVVAAGVVSSLGTHCESTNVTASILELICCLEGIGLLLYLHGLKNVLALLKILWLLKLARRHLLRLTDEWARSWLLLCPIRERVLLNLLPKCEVALLLSRNHSLLLAWCERVL